VAIEVIMPKLGMTMEEGTIISWLRQEGEQLAEGEPLFEVETDKVTMEVPAPASGVLRKVLAKPGSTLTVGQTIAIISQPGEVMAEFPAFQTLSPKSSLKPTEIGDSGSNARGSESETASDNLLRASPAAKKLAREHGIDLKSLIGSGPSGRILESDVMQAIGGLFASASVSADLAVSTVSDEVHQTQFAKAGTIKLSGLRKRTAERMAESFRTVPHFYLTIEVQADRLTALREALLGPVLDLTGVRLSYTDLLAKGLAVALRQHPEVNAAWDNGEIRRNHDINIGIAVATRNGILVPVIRRADALSVAEIARRRAALVEAARSRRIGLDSLEGGTMTLTNLGAYGVDTFAPIINPPQAAILAAGRITQRAVAVSGTLTLRPTVFLTLAADHRVLDGHEAAAFLSDIRKWVESAELDRLDFPKDAE
jgi:pyruvate dehydrogenase E2 component (dihydrolipoamide acetyltransferase)